MPVFWEWLHYISPFKYSFEALLKIHFEGLNFSDYDSCLASYGTCYGSDGTQILTAIGGNGSNYNDVNIGVWMAVLIGIALTLRVLSYFLCLLKV
jgi:hypothetical protein